MVIEDHIIKGCQKRKRKDQQKLYDLLAPTLFLICLRYAKDREEAKDILQEAFGHLFKKIKQFQFKGSFEGWAKRLTINQALQHLRKQNRLLETEEITEQEAITQNLFFSQETEKNELLHLLNKLPERKKIIFNLYAIEGYKHKEIAEMLNITENASSSLYFKAKVTLQELYIKEYGQINA